jgi:hypothetical protein
VWHDRDGRVYGGNNGYYGNGRPGVWGAPGSYGNGVYRNGGGYYGRGSAASQIGYQDGYNEGVRDRQTGHSFRPTSSDAYKDADHGYNSSMGDKNSYHNAYREAYTQGYQRGYGR